jgi:hypothetical protein
MQSAFEIVIFVVVGLAVVVAVVALVCNNNVYDQIGRGGLFGGEPRGRGPSPRDSGRAGDAGPEAEREQEIRQMLSARSALRTRRGEPALDLETELQRLLSPAAPDPELVEEVRQLVIARNARRLRRGDTALDVEAEVQRRLRELPG